MTGKLNYSFARRIGSYGTWERVIDTDSETDENGSYVGDPDMFKLEHSGWARHVEFMPIASAGAQS